MKHCALGIVLFIVVTLLMPAGAAEPVQPRFQATQAKGFERTFFGLHVLRPFQNKLWRTSGHGTVRLHDLSVSWRELEPQPAQWRWQQLDESVRIVLETGADIVLPLQNTPAWASAEPDIAGAYGPGSAGPPKEVADWENYVSKVVERYKGRIAYYELWNEPNIKKFFRGSPASLADLTKRTATIVKRIDTNAKVVCAGITGQYGLPWLNAYLMAGAAASCDVVGYHLYTGHQRPETFVRTIAGVREAMARSGAASKPLWNTESGWLIGHGQLNDAVSAGFDKSAKVLSPETAVEYLIRSHLLARSLDIDRFYWYAWDHAQMGLSAGRGQTETIVSSAYTSLSKFLIGTTLENCSQVELTWTCTLKSDRFKYMFSWLEEGEGDRVHKVAGVALAFDKTGSLVEIGPVLVGQKYKLSGLPIIVKSTLN